MSDSYHTQGAQQDRAYTWKLQQEQNTQLTRIADALEQMARWFPDRMAAESPEILFNAQDPFSVTCETCDEFATFQRENYFAGEGAAFSFALGHAEANLNHRVHVQTPESRKSGTPFARSIEFIECPACDAAYDHYSFDACPACAQQDVVLATVMDGETR